MSDRAHPRGTTSPKMRGAPFKKGNGFSHHIDYLIGNKNISGTAFPRRMEPNHEEECSRLLRQYFQTFQWDRKTGLVTKILKSPAISKVFFLIANGTNYNQKIAEEYYQLSNNSRKKLASNPKVISIYLAHLVGAGLIMKTEKRGRFQHYGLNYEGILNVLAIGFLHHEYTITPYGERDDSPKSLGPTKTPERVNYYWQGLHKYIMDKAGGHPLSEDILHECVREYDSYFIESLIRPYFESRRYCLETESPWVFGGSEVRWKDHGTTLEQEFTRFKDILLTDIPVHCRELVNGFIAKKTPLSWFYRHIMDEYKAGDFGLLGAENTPEGFIFGRVKSMMEGKNYGKRDWTNKEIRQSRRRG